MLRNEAGGKGDDFSHRMPQKMPNRCVQQTGSCGVGITDAQLGIQGEYTVSQRRQRNAAALPFGLQRAVSLVAFIDGTLHG